MPAALPNAFSGVSFLIQIENPASSGTFKTIGGMKSNGGNIAPGHFDTTTKDGTRFQRMITGGIIKMSLSGSGCFVDDQVLSYVHTLLMTNVDARYRLISANGDSYDGRFFVKDLARSGGTGGAEDFTISFESNGTITYTAPPPTITSVAPTAGPGTIPTAGGTACTIVGTKFQLGATATFGGVACTSVVIVDPFTITVISPAHAAGAVAVVVTNADGTIVTLGAAITYV